MQPKVFISYSWSTPQHQSLIQQWATQLVADGVDIVLDIYDLKEGQDKFIFMEKMVADPSVTHVLVICDKVYAEKADARKAGVGTESQIMSREIYEKTEQTKFIPIVCEFSETGEPYLPIFLKSRIWINFSSPTAVSDNWERLIRLIFEKPLHEKPKRGKPPAYITNHSTADSTPVAPAVKKLSEPIVNAEKIFRAPRQHSLKKISEISLMFWIAKFFATNFGENIATHINIELINRNIYSNVFMGMWICTGIALVAIIAQSALKTLHPLLFWVTIILIAPLDATLVSLNYYVERDVTQMIMVFGLLTAALLFFWHRTLGSVSVGSVGTMKSVICCWATIIVAQAFGGVFGVWVYELTLGDGFLNPLLLCASVAAIVALYYWTTISRSVLFWAAIILTYPCGTAIYPPAFRYNADLNVYSPIAILFVVTVVCVLISWHTSVKREIPVKQEV